MDLSTLESFGGAIATVAGAGVTGWFAMRVSRHQSTATPYDRLAERVAHLEEKSEQQDEEISILRRGTARWEMFYDDLHFNWDRHRVRDAPPPRPQTLEPYLTEKEKR